jgi:hypothetical protein
MQPMAVYRRKRTKLHTTLDNTMWCVFLFTMYGYLGYLVGQLPLPL